MQNAEMARAARVFVGHFEKTARRAIFPRSALKKF
jgi:hypothetical protein